MSATIGTADEHRVLRIELLAAEKAHSKATEALAKKRRELPMVPVEKDYELVGSTGKIKLSELFIADTKDLYVYHMMDSPEWGKACSLCCFFVDQLNGALSHLLPRMSIAVVANAPYEKLESLRQSKGWQIPLFSGEGSGFGQAMGVSFTKEQIEAKSCNYNYTGSWDYGAEAPGSFTFHKHDGAVFHTYSTFAAGLATTSLVHSILDLTAAGRAEGAPNTNMFWVKHKEDYNEAPEAD